MILLREISSDTVHEVCSLSVRDDQNIFVASNALSIAEAYFHPSRAWFRAIYADDTVVGFLMLDDQPKKPEYYLWRFMIDKKYQKIGYGQQALELLIGYVKTRPNATELLTSVIQAPGSPQAFYEKIGFQLTGAYQDGEAIMRLPLSK